MGLCAGTGLPLSPTMVTKFYQDPSVPKIPLQAKRHHLLDNGLHHEYKLEKIAA